MDDLIEVNLAEANITNAEQDMKYQQQQQQPKELPASEKSGLSLINWYLTTAVTLGGRLNGKAVAYAASSLAAALIINVFEFYYVKIFLERYHVTESWFQTVQVAFLVWNTLNDPLFACLQDNVRSLPFMRTRRQSVLYGAPLFVLSFLLPWFPWADYDNQATPAWIAGLQLLTSLCFYDTLFTFVLLAVCAMTAELTTDRTERVQLVRYSKVAQMIGSMSVVTCEFTSTSLTNYFAFQMTCIGLGVVAGLCFVYTGLNARTSFDRHDKPSIVVSVIADPPTLSAQEPKPVSPSVDTSGKANVMTAIRSAFIQAKQYMTNADFASLVTVNFFQMYHLCYLASFTNIIGSQLIGDNAMPPAVKSLFYGSMFLVPKILFFIAAPYVPSFGYYRIMRASFILKLVNGIVFLIVGYENGRVSAAFFLLESINVFGGFSFFDLCMADVIDSDFHRYKRKFPISSTAFGLNALITKPAQSFAPMITVAILNRYGYSSGEWKTGANDGWHDGHNATIANLNVTAAAANAALSTALPSNTNPASLTDAMFLTSCVVTISIGLVQLVLWNFYKIRATRETNIYEVDARTE